MINLRPSFWRRGNRKRPNFDLNVIRKVDVKNWDVFISHASEDKASVALPLAESLIRSGIRVWLDQFELRIGDSLREKIDEGLSESSFGVIILSEHFLNKGWTKKELNGLFSLEVDGVSVILPVWHGLDKADITRFSPLLADKLAANTALGVPSVARSIAQAILERGAKPGQGTTSLTKQFVGVLDQGPLLLNVTTFLANYSEVLPAAIGHFGFMPERAVYRVQPKLGDFGPDLAVGSLVSTAGHVDWVYFFFCPADGPLFEGTLPIGALKRSSENLRNHIGWVDENPKKAIEILIPNDQHSSLYGSHRCIILAGRRESLSESDREGIRILRTEGIVVRSYDWLLEACAAIEREPSGDDRRRVNPRGISEQL
jgi:TIR domain